MTDGSERTIHTRHGRGRLLVSPAAEPVAVLVLAHGAGGGAGSADLAAIAAELPSHGVTVVRHEQPWVVAGRRVAPRPATLDEAWLDTLPAVRELAGDAPLVLGGRSAGARVACRTATASGAVGVVCLAFPLHPPGRPDRSRAHELAEPRVPVLVVQGDRDPFGSGADVDGAGVAGVEVVAIPEANHALAVGKRAARTNDETLGLVVDAVARHVTAVVSAAAS